MQQGICNPEFYGDLVWKFKKSIGNPNFPFRFRSDTTADYPLDYDYFGIPCYLFFVFCSKKTHIKNIKKHKKKLFCCLDLIFVLSKLFSVLA